MKAKNHPFINSRRASWIKTLYALFVIAVPALLLWIFFSDDFLAIQPLAWGWQVTLALGFVAGTTLVTVILIHFQLLEPSVLAFTLPVAICFMVIFLTSALAPWQRALLLAPFLCLTIPIHMLCKKWELKRWHQHHQSKSNKTFRHH